MIFNITVKQDQSDIDKILKSIDFKIKGRDIPEEVVKEYGFKSELNVYRNKIDKIEPDIWKKIRWYINNFDFLVKDPIINRAFYKYWEIINTFEIFNNYNNSDIIFHCAEAPGGFIQGSNILLQLENFKQQNVVINKSLVDNDGFMEVKKKRKQQKKLHKIYTISLNKDLPKYKNYNLPSYNKRVVNENIRVTYGKDNTGDINNLDNIHYIKNLINNDGFFLITADGGFDEGTDFNNKEQLHYYLILNEIYSAIYLQKQGGCFILKVFDIFTKTSINLLYLLSLLYKNVFVYKPKTSRPTNSEKYIICKNFKCNNETLKHVITILQNLSQKLKYQKEKYNSFTLFESISSEFLNNIYNVNNALVDNQCKFLKIAIDLCDNKNFINNYDNELNNSLEQRKKIFKQWESKYGLCDFIPF